MELYDLIKKHCESVPHTEFNEKGLGVEVRYNNKEVNMTFIDTYKPKIAKISTSELYKVTKIYTGTYGHCESEAEGCIYDIAESTYLFEDKEKAWKYFYDKFPEILENTSAFIGWNDEIVELSLDDYDSTSYILHKWDGFDGDVELGWQVKGDDKVYHSYKELWEAHPSFDGVYMSGDRPWFHSKDLKEVAELYTKTMWDKMQRKKIPDGVKEAIANHHNISIKDVCRVEYCEGLDNSVAIGNEEWFEADTFSFIYRLRDETSYRMVEEWSYNGYDVGSIGKKVEYEFREEPLSEEEFEQIEKEERLDLDLPF